VSEIVAFGVFALIIFAAIIIWGLWRL